MKFLQSLEEHKICAQFTSTKYPLWNRLYHA